jgi:hypothetical protein
VRAGLPDAPGARTYDLSEELARQQRAAAQPFIAAFGVGFGLLLVLGGSVLLGGSSRVGGGFMLASGCLLIGLVAASIYLGRVDGIAGLQVGASGLRVRLSGGKVLELGWSDPKLSFDVAVITGDLAALIPDARVPERIQPQWVVFHYPKTLRSTIPHALLDDLLTTSREHDLASTPADTLLFWTAGKYTGPGLVSRDVGPGDDTRPNGRVIRVRGAHAGSYLFGGG